MAVMLRTGAAGAAYRRYYPPPSLLLLLPAAVAYTKSPFSLLMLLHCDYLAVCHITYTPLMFGSFI